MNYLHDDLPAAPLVWLDSRAAIAMTAEATRAFPTETGGILIGYRDGRSRQSVICACVGPGPRAIHRPTGFLPDHRYHEREAARLYAESGRIWSYLGDWHSHPLGLPVLSWKDKRTLARIARSAQARATRPLMLLLAGSPASESRSSREGTANAATSGPQAALFDGWQVVAWQLMNVPSVLDAALARVSPTRGSVHLFAQIDP